LGARIPLAYARVKQGFKVYSATMDVCLSGREKQTKPRIKTSRNKIGQFAEKQSYGKWT
jgi:hypothetical protein